MIRIVICLFVVTNLFGSGFKVNKQFKSEYLVNIDLINQSDGIQMNFVEEPQFTDFTENKYNRHYILHLKLEFGVPLEPGDLMKVLLLVNIY